MPYISSSGNIGGDQGWSLSKIPNLFWGLVNFIVLFFQTLINPDLTKRGDGYSSSYGAPGRGPPPGPPSRRIGRIHRGGGAAPPPMGGGG
ncbi:selenoprotein K-like [Penaeus chinensis]|uniref:selenoprotein K-like n=1 Tax=Penaeus chinensis TaxID=139456 RepID=UPI001FB7853F|nr:selenoprotein K-like [Penaeus chinensis]